MSFIWIVWGTLYVYLWGKPTNICSFFRLVYWNDVSCGLPYFVLCSCMSDQKKSGRKICRTRKWRTAGPQGPLWRWRVPRIHTTVSSDHFWFDLFTYRVTCELFLYASLSENCNFCYTFPQTWVLSVPKVIFLQVAEFSG